VNPNLTFLLIGLGIALLVISVVAYYYVRPSYGQHSHRNGTRPTVPVPRPSTRPPIRPRNIPNKRTPVSLESGRVWSDVDTLDMDDSPPRLVRPYVMHAHARRDSLRSIGRMAPRVRPETIARPSVFAKAS
jgi:hypothetical protein